MLVLAVTLHNIPEDFPQGLFCRGNCGKQYGDDRRSLCAGCGNCDPEFSRGSHYFPAPSRPWGEPRQILCIRGAFRCSGAAGCGLTLLVASYVEPVLPYLLSFAAGAMIYVVVEELIPEASEGKHSNVGTIAFAVGLC